MSNIARRKGGGFFDIPNRWIDAGFMRACPGSVTQVYLHLSRWADNESDQAAQPMRLIANMCGLSEDVARKALRNLEEWGVIHLEEETGKNGENIWTILELPKKAPEYPGIGSKKGVVKSVGGSENQDPNFVAPHKSSPHKSPPLNQTNSDQTELNQTELKNKDEPDGTSVSTSEPDQSLSDSSPGAVAPEPTLRSHSGSRPSGKVRQQRPAANRISASRQPDQKAKAVEMDGIEHDPWNGVSFDDFDRMDSYRQDEMLAMLPGGPGLFKNGKPKAGKRYGNKNQLEWQRVVVGYYRGKGYEVGDVSKKLWEQTLSTFIRKLADQYTAVDVQHCTWEMANGWWSDKLAALKPEKVIDELAAKVASKRAWQRNPASRQGGSGKGGRLTIEDMDRFIEQAENGGGF